MTLEDFGFDVRGMDDEAYSDTERLAEAIEMYVCEIVEEQARGFALDLAHGFLAKVDWEEIAEHMVYDARAELV